MVVLSASRHEGRPGIAALTSPHLMPDYSISVHDELPPQAAATVDAGLEAANLAAASLHEVASFGCLAHTPLGELVGGAVGRRWGACSELLQLWVQPERRRQGLGRQLVQAFEALARTRGCTSVYLETFSFQAPALYRALGYAVEYERREFPHGIVKYHLLKTLGTDEGSPPAPSGGLP